MLSCFKEISVFNANMVYFDQTPRSAASDLDLLCLQVTLLWEAWHILINTAEYMYHIRAGTQHQNDVVSTSMRRDHVASTLIRRHFNVVCLLGILLSYIPQPDPILDRKLL